MKKYTIGGKEFEMQPLTLRQRKLAAPVQQKLMAVIQKTVASVVNNAMQPVKLVEIGIDMDSIITGDDSFERFLATILTPAGAGWTPECIAVNMETMLDIDEDTQTEVLQDFLTRQSGLKPALQDSTPVSPSEKSQSSTNASAAE